MGIGTIVISEILIALLVGAVPLLISIEANPNMEIVSWLTAITPGDPVVEYLFYLLVLHIFIWAINKYLVQTNRSVSKYIKVVHKFTHQVGFTIHSIYRVIAGAVPTSIVLLIKQHGFTEGALLVSFMSTILVIGSIFMCSFLTWLNETTAPKRKFL